MKTTVIDKQYKTICAPSMLFSNNERSVGAILTAHGVVAVWCSQFWSYTALEIVKDGVLYERRFNKAYSDRYLVTLAKRFAAEIAEKENDEPN